MALRLGLWTLDKHKPQDPIRVIPVVVNASMSAPRSTLELANNFSFLSQSLKFSVVSNFYPLYPYRVVASAEGGRGTCRGQDEGRSQQRINSKCLHDVAAPVVPPVLVLVSGTLAPVS